ncbi:MAG: hypothetical protein MUD03_10355 [Pirellula sp.]|nr:hypothetical protein [Pirellula sp.]
MNGVYRQFSLGKMFCVMSLVALPCIATYQYQVFRSDVLKFKANVSYLVIGKTREEILREVIGRNPQVAMDESSVLLQDTWRIYLFHEMSIIYGAVDGDARAQMVIFDDEFLP